VLPPYWAKDGPDKNRVTKIPDTSRVALNDLKARLPLVVDVSRACSAIERFSSEAAEVALAVT